MSEAANSHEIVARARAYYDSDDADRFYQVVWGGEDIHVGIYENERESIAVASQRTVTRMASLLEELGADARILDLGSGYCGAARYLAKTFGCRVVALNISEVENRRAREMNDAAGVGDLIEVIDGSFESLPFSQSEFDFAWSQDAVLHSSRRADVLTEVARVLRPGGRFVFTDPMQADDCPANVLQPILDRIHLSSLGSPAFYREAGQSAGFRELNFLAMPEYLTLHYQRVFEELQARKDELSKIISIDYLDRMAGGLQRWVEGGRAGHLAWGIFLFEKV